MLIVCMYSLADSIKQVWTANGHLYQRFDTPLAWMDAAEYCERLGGHLVTITSAGENEFVYRMFGIDGVNLWLGATDRDREGEWRWVTGESWTYNNWSKINRPQPDNAGRGQNYAVFWDLAPAQWDDNGMPEGNFRYVFVCEWEPTL